MKVKTFIRFLADDDGATMAEYALILSLIAIVCVVAVKQIGLSTSTMFQNLANTM